MARQSKKPTVASLAERVAYLEGQLQGQDPIAQIWNFASNERTVALEAWTNTPAWRLLLTPWVGIGHYQRFLFCQRFSEHLFDILYPPEPDEENGKEESSEDVE